MARLVVISPGTAASVHELGDGWTTVGRGDGNSFQVVEPSISGRHCEVRLQGDALQVRDLQSTNGTFIEGRRVSDGVVKPGATLRLGDVELRFEAAGAETSSDAAFTSKKLMTHAGAQSKAEATAPVEEQLVVAPAMGSDVEKQFQVLLVDDSLAFLELFGGLCAEFSSYTWHIHRAVSADAALALLRDTVMDLVVLDIGMPMLDGLQLLAILNRRYPGLKIAIMTGGSTEAKRADALAKGADLFLEKPATPEGMLAVYNMLQDLLSWAREGFTGALRQVNLQEVVQVQCHGRHSAILEIRNPKMRGQIYIEAGEVTHAVVGDLIGELAFQRLMSLRGGEFQLMPFQPPPQRSLHARWENLLMDAARATDEETVMFKQPAAPRPAPAPAPEGEAKHVALGDDLIVLPAAEPPLKPPHDGKN
jgi:CheY-like chemotaxis protein